MNVVLIGYGYWGPNIAKNISNSEKMNLYAICDIDQERLLKAKSIYGESVKYYNNYNVALENAEVDSFALALKNDIGQQIAEKVLQAGKHLFMEKPLAKSVNEATILKTLADKSRVILHVDHILLFHPVIKKIKEIIDSGEFGELLYFDSSRMNLGPAIKNDVNAMWDLAVHDLAVIDYISNGMESVQVNALGLNKYGSKESLTYLSIKYNGFIAMLKSSWISPVKERLMIIAGTNKMIVFDDMKTEKLMIYDKGVDVCPTMYEEYGKYEMKIRTGDLYAPYISQEDALLNSLNHFADCVKLRKQSVSNADQAIRILKILEQADRDLNENKII